MLDEDERIIRKVCGYNLQGRNKREDQGDADSREEETVFPTEEGTYGGIQYPREARGRTIYAHQTFVT